MKRTKEYLLNKAAQLLASEEARAALEAQIMRNRGFARRESILAEAEQRAEQWGERGKSYKAEKIMAEAGKKAALHLARWEAKAQAHEADIKARAELRAQQLRERATQL